MHVHIVFMLLGICSCVQKKKTYSQVRVQTDTRGMIVVGDRGARSYLSDYMQVHVSCKHCPDIKAQSTVLGFLFCHVDFGTSQCFMVESEV